MRRFRVRKAPRPGGLHTSWGPLPSPRSAVLLGAPRLLTGERHLSTTGGGGLGHRVARTGSRPRFVLAGCTLRSTPAIWTAQSHFLRRMLSLVGAARANGTSADIALHELGRNSSAVAEQCGWVTQLL